MSGSGWVLLKTLCWCVTLVVPVVAIMPWWLSQQTGHSLAWTGQPIQWIGVWLLLNGIGLCGWPPARVPCFKQSEVFYPFCPPHAREIGLSADVARPAGDGREARLGVLGIHRGTRRL